MNTQTNQESIFEEFDKPINRRSLLTWWIKTFCWIFMILSFFSLFGIVAGLFSWHFQMTLYGFETVEPFSIMGIFILLIMLFKGYTAYTLWFEKDEAILLGQIDAWAGIIICTFTMLILPIFSEGYSISLRLEILFLIPFLKHLKDIKDKW